MDDHVAKLLARGIISDRAAQRMMTHQAEQPNPAKPYVDAIARRLKPVDLTPIHLPGTQPRDYLTELARNPDILAQNIEQAGNFNFGGVTRGIKAFHGSPHDFDKFDLSQIGTGEGAQAYGHGLYFAENEGVAKSYKNIADMTIGGKKYDPYNPVHAATAQVEESGSRAAAIRDTEARLKQSPSPGEFLPKVLDFLKGDQPLPEFKSSGRMYQVSINADPEHFLDWDKPLSEQSEHVQQVLKKIGYKPPRPDFPAQAMVDDLATQRGAGYASGKGEETLRAAGIPGIKYLDQGSRFTEHQSLRQEIAGYERELQALNSPDWPRPPGGVPLGHAERVSEALAAAKESLAKLGPESSTRNYVVFDDKLIDILKKYGIAGIGALPAMGAYHFQDQDLPQQ